MHAASTHKCEIIEWYDAQLAMNRAAVRLRVVLHVGDEAPSTLTLVSEFLPEERGNSKMIAEIERALRNEAARRAEESGREIAQEIDT